MKAVSSDKESPHVADKRLYLKPDEARRLIAAAGKCGRNRLRDKLLVQMTYRHGLRASEAVGVCWSQIDLGDGTFHVTRLKTGKASTHTMERDEVRDLKKLRLADK